MIGLSVVVDSRARKVFDFTESGLIAENQTIFVFLLEQFIDELNDLIT